MKTMNISFEIYFNSLSKTCFANVFLLLGCHNANFGPLIMRQPFSLDFNHVMLWDWPKGHWEPCNKLKCLSPAKCLMRFEPFDLNLLLHSPLHLKALTLFPQCLNLNSPLLFFCHCHCVTTLFIFNKNKFLLALYN